ncbi:MAG TPA: tRNA (adenosine(37)-N6)-threonylcarbamoyltransferase complex ATPase subunit type 1 TsaE [Gemmatimonadales bacterium]|nr:tRNA (adenosine(37)-N6)-threonylcarbamoyltransferase complex ATPase subunit type 1 TsaE [Gemmatimonadales bacterium]
MIRELIEEELRQEGERLGRELAPHSVVALEGELGSGKTTFAAAVARGLGVRESAASPTYALVHRYQGRRGPVYHLDCYRLRGPEEAADLDWETVLSDGDVVIVEWPERAGAWLPAPTLRYRFHHLADDSRRGVERVG